MGKKPMCEEACAIIGREIEEYKADTSALEHERKALVAKLLKAQSEGIFDNIKGDLTGLLAQINNNKKFTHLLKIIYKENCVPLTKWGSDGINSCSLNDILTSILPTKKTRTRKKNAKKKRKK